MSDVRQIFGPAVQQWSCEIVFYGDESKPEFHYLGPWPGEALKFELVGSLEQLLDAAPARSSLRARLERVEQDFRLHLVLTHANGVMQAVEVAANPRKAIRRTVSAMQLKIHGWRAQRSLDHAVPTLAADRHSTPRVLIVDDNPISIRLIEACLHQLGCETSVVTTGREAVREMTANDYDLLVLDWVMPEMSGADTLRRVQDIITYDASFRLPWVTSQLPVVTYSGSDVKQMGIPECANFDVVGHISKAATLPEIRKITASILGELRAA